MKYMNGKAKMMVAGIVLGTVAAGGMAALIAAGKIGLAGSLVVMFLMALAGIGGWLLGIQMRVKIDRDRAWLRGYKDGRENSLPPTTMIAEHILIRYRKSGL